MKLNLVIERKTKIFILIYLFIQREHISAHACLTPRGRPAQNFKR